MNSENTNRYNNLQKGKSKDAIRFQKETVTRFGELYTLLTSEIFVEYGPHYLTC